MHRVPLRNYKTRDVSDVGPRNLSASRNSRAWWPPLTSGSSALRPPLRSTLRDFLQRHLITKHRAWHLVPDGHVAQSPLHTTQQSSVSCQQHLACAGDLSRGHCKRAKAASDTFNCFEKKSHTSTLAHAMVDAVAQTGWHTPCGRGRAATISHHAPAKPVHRDLFLWHFLKVDKEGTHTSPPHSHARTRKHTHVC